MDDWDPFADPADTAAPAADTVPAAPVVRVAPVPRGTEVRMVGTAPLPSLQELEELLPLQLDECPELVQAAFAGDEAKVQEISVESFGWFVHFWRFWGSSSLAHGSFFAPFQAPASC